MRQLCAWRTRAPPTLEPKLGGPQGGLYVGRDACCGKGLPYRGSA